MKEFAEKEVAPRAAEVDRSNNFPMVRLPTGPRRIIVTFQWIGFVGEDGNHGFAGNYC